MVNYIFLALGPVLGPKWFHGEAKNPSDKSSRQGRSVFQFANDGEGENLPFLAHHILPRHNQSEGAEGNRAGGENQSSRVG